MCGQQVSGMVYIVIDMKTVTTREGTYEGDQRCPSCTYLLDGTLSRAIEPHSDLPVMSP